MLLKWIQLRSEPWKGLFGAVRASWIRDGRRELKASPPSPLSFLSPLCAAQPDAESKGAWVEQLLEGEGGGCIQARWLRITGTRNKPQSFYYISSLALIALHKSSLIVKTKLRVRSAFSFHTSQKRKLRFRRPSGFSKSVPSSLVSLWVQRVFFLLGYSVPFIHSTNIYGVL